MGKILSIFIDESGDVGFIKDASKYYIITFVIHNQNDDISENIRKFNNELALLGFDQYHCVHNGPIICTKRPAP